MNEPRTLTEAIERIGNKLSGLEWTEVIYNRVAIHDVKLAGQDKPQIKPMAYVGNGEYADCRPNDNYTSVVFFASKDPEKNDYNQASPFGHAQNHINHATRAVTLYGWVNLSKLPDYDDGSGFPEKIKLQVKKSLQLVRCVTQITGYQDGVLPDVFRPFVVSDLDRKYDRWPTVAFRIDFTVMTVETNVS
ncbi:hypothetical protein [Spirosoma areae]